MQLLDADPVPTVSLGLMQSLLSESMFCRSQVVTNRSLLQGFVENWKG